MPRPSQPTYGPWRESLEAIGVDGSTILVGHSCGAGFLVRWLSETRTQIRGIALIAPWIDPDETLPTGMFDFSLTGLSLVLPARRSLFISLDDDQDVRTSAHILARHCSPIETFVFHRRGHFTDETPEGADLPELPAWVLLNSSSGGGRG